MRKFVKTAAVLALALALLSTSAFAAFGGSVAKDGTYTATINDATAGEQITLIAVDKIAGSAIASDANILYIDQKEANGTSDSFSSFSVVGDDAGKRVYFFAGSQSGETAAYLGDVDNYTVTLQDSYSAAVREEVSIAVTVAPALDTGDNVAWTATGGTINGTNVGATFTAEAAGTYTVTATVNGVSDTTTVTVAADTEGIAIDSELAVDIVNDTTAENEVGLAVAITISDAQAFNKMIWVLVTADNRYYSEPVDYVGGTSGNVTLAAAFKNGAKNLENSLEVTGVEAIFKTADGTEYFTDKANDDTADRRQSAN